MEKLSSSLFDDQTLTTPDGRTAGACGGTLCATAIGGTRTRCITRVGCTPQDALLDTGQ